MLKMAGLLLIIMSSSALGFTYSRQLSQRVRQLKSLQHIALLLKAEIDYGNASLPEAMETIAAKEQPPFNYFLESMAQKLNSHTQQPLAQLYEEEVQKQLAPTSLKEKDLFEFSQLGKGLGYLDKGQQLRTLELYLKEVGREIQEAMDELPQKQKLFRSLGVMGGLFLAILII